jgi:hypothetical protein
MAFPSRLLSLATWKKPSMLSSRELQQKSSLTLVVLPVPTVVVMEVLMMLRRDERRYDFGMCVCHVM